MPKKNVKPKVPKEESKPAKDGVSLKRKVAARKLVKHGKK